MLHAFTLPRYTTSAMRSSRQTADPVMDMEPIRSPTGVWTASSPTCATGQRAHAERRRAPRAAAGHGERDFHRRARPDGRVPATFEVVYGHAWKAALRVAADGRAIIRIDRNRSRRKPA
jgi:malonyl-CoA O-methyltransferase